MKSTLKYAGIIFLFTCSMMILLNTLQVTRRRNEIDQSLALSLRNTIKTTSYDSLSIVNETIMQAEFIRNLAELLNSNDAYEVIIHGLSTQGFLDVTLRNHFQHLNGVSGMEEVRRSILLESYDE